MFLVNIPSFFHMAWRMVSTALDDRVKNKIYFLRNRDLPVLQDFIDGVANHQPTITPIRSKLCILLSAMSPNPSSRPVALELPIVNFGHPLPIGFRA